ncbi:low affinity immunoglobulin gamma Fc region receptor II-a [Phalacrocorax aristotelis]|uniref:low affinity immunoglobulin gamma Fc region receptor II-a n=1 Tax=Phalacrocorax aristotelis TaxID=126867 RepID=UPI003F4C98BA
MGTAQALGFTGARPSQLTLDPPWTPVFLWEKVTLTCQGSGTPGPTSWYRNTQFWEQTASSHIHVSEGSSGSSSYQCRSPGTELSSPVTLSFSNDWLVLQVPVGSLLEGDTLPLRCRGWKGKSITQVQFFREWEVLGGPSPTTELLLPSLQLHHSGRYRCQATMRTIFQEKKESALVTVNVQELFSVPVLRLEGLAKLPEGAPLALHCLSHHSPLRPLARLQHLFYRNKVVVGGPQGSSQLWLPAVGLLHSGNYSCEVRTETSSVRKYSALVAVMVYRVPVSGVSLAVQPPGGLVAEGDHLELACSVAAGTGPLSFSWHRQGLAAPLATGPRYKLRAVQQQDGGRYHCTATNGGTTADSPPLWVTVLVPVANATIAMTRTEPSVPAGESLNLSCSVQAGTTPVTFTWLRDGQELGSGPVLTLGTVEQAHAGTYQCLATNRLSTRRIFRVYSPALVLSVTQPQRGWRQQGTAMAVGLSMSLLLLLLLSAAMAWHLRHRRHRGRSPTPGTGGRVGGPKWGESPPHQLGGDQWGCTPHPPSWLGLSPQCPWLRVLGGFGGPGGPPCLKPTSPHLIWVCRATGKSQGR